MLNNNNLFTLSILATITTDLIQISSTTQDG